MEIRHPRITATLRRREPACEASAFLPVFWNVGHEIQGDPIAVVLPFSSPPYPAPPPAPLPTSPLRRMCSIISLERVGEVFHQVRFPLTYTPRRMAIHPSTGRMIIIESDHGPMTEQERLDHVKA